MAKEGGRGDGTWLSDVSMSQTKVAKLGLSSGQADSGYIFTPNKSRWQKFSEVDSDTEATFSFFPFNTDDFHLSYDEFVDDYRHNFTSALEAIRKRFANQHVLNSILPKTSFEVGNH